jgi:23S rRNA (pseudouridine1915-N3)-methyltransferase
MKLLLTAITGRPGSGPAQQLFETYTTRLAAYVATEIQVHRTEQSLLDSITKNRARTQPMLVLLDSRGKHLSSESFAAWLGEQKDSSRQLVIFAIGPADGWSVPARQQAGLLLSLGPMTLPHELARVVLAEQLYRAFTILAGHPYHAGHTSPGN